MGTWAAVTLGAPPHSFASRCICLWVPFSLSALVHVLDDFALSNKYAPKTLLGLPHAREVLAGNIALPAVLPVSDVREDRIIALFNRAWAVSPYKCSKGKGGENHKTPYPPWLVMLGKIIGHIWVYIWFCATLPQYARRLFRHLVFCGGTVRCKLQECSRYMRNICSTYDYYKICCVLLTF